MSKYAEMSDFEINNLVTAKDFIFKGGSFIDFENKDYCSNPSDAWPIILENKISIAFAASSEETQASGGLYCCIDKNPLRAAMIVYLMLDGEI